MGVSSDASTFGTAQILLTSKSTRDHFSTEYADVRGLTGETFGDAAQELAQGQYVVPA